MKIRKLFRGAAGVGAALSLLAVGAAPAAAQSTACNPPAPSQPFLSFGDSSWYVPAPGESYDNFAGKGWTLSGGASIQRTGLYDGTRGNVLDLPAGASAVSPATCVNNLYPYLRTMVKDTNGGSVGVFISYQNLDGSWSSKKSAGLAKSPSSPWALSNDVMLPAGSFSGWLYARVTLVGQGSSTDNQIYNLYLDPRMKH